MAWFNEADADVGFDMEFCLEIAQHPFEWLDRRAKSFNRGGVVGCRSHGRIETVAAAEVANPGDPLRDVVDDRGNGRFGHVQRDDRLVRLFGCR